jgi:hypothetical protein
MEAIEIEKLNQLISRTDLTGNEKVAWLTNFIDKREHISERSKQLGIDGLKRVAETTKDSWSRQIAEQFLYEIEEIAIEEIEKDLKPTTIISQTKTKTKTNE